MTDIDTYAAMTPGQFREDVVPQGRPAVFRGLVGDWPAVRAGGDPHELLRYLGTHDSGAPLSTYVGAPAIRGRFFYSSDMRGLNFDRVSAPFAGVAQTLLAGMAADDAPAIYSGAAAATDHFPTFAAANPMPLLDTTIMPRLWLGNRTTVSTHYDVADNIACVAAGRRRFTLFPPEQVGNLYVGPLENTISGQPVSMVDLADPDFETHPRFREALAASSVVELAPGDAIYVPSLWWHNVESLDAINLLVNYWWNTPHQGSAFEVMIHGMLAIRDLPDRERRAWRAFFEHFVFEADGETAAHLPDHAQGVLGPASASRTAMIRDFLMRGLGRIA